LSELFTRKRGSTEVRLRLEKARDFQVVMDVPIRFRPDANFAPSWKDMRRNPWNSAG